MTATLLPASVVRIRCVTDIDGHLRRADIALPAQLPLAEILPDLVQLLHPDAPPGVRWQLLSERGTALPMSDTALEAGLRPGERITLTQSVFTPPPAHITDAAALLADSSAQHTDGASDVWAGAAITVLTSVAVAGWWLWSPPVGDAITALIAVGTAAISMILAAAGQRFPAVPALFTTVVVVQALMFAAVGAVLFVGAQWEWQTAAATTTTAALALVAAIMLPEARRLACAVVIASVATVAFTALLLAGLAAPSAAAACLAVALLGIVLTPSAAVSLSGIHIPDVPAAGEELSKADRRQSPEVVVRVADRAAALFDGGIAGWMLVVAGCGGVIALTRPSWWTLALVATSAVACAIQSRGQARLLPGFSLAFGATVLAGAGCLIATSLGAWYVVAPVLLALLAAMPISFGVQLWRTPSPAARRTLELVESACLGAAIPLATVVSGLVALVRGLG